MDDKIVLLIRELIEKAFNNSNDSKIGLYLKLNDILDYYYSKTSIERKIKLDKENNLKELERKF